MHTLAGQEGSVCTVSFSPNGRHIASGSDDGLVKIWVAETGAEVSSFDRLRSLWKCDWGDFMLALGAGFALDVV